MFIEVVWNPIIKRSPYLRNEVLWHWIDLDSCWQVDDDGNVSLTIRKAELKDAGKYTCKIEEFGKEGENETSCQVTIGGRIHYIPTKSSKHLKSGEGSGQEWSRGPGIWINEVKCVFNKNTMKICIGCSWWCPGTFASCSVHLMASLYLCGSRSSVKARLKGFLSLFDALQGYETQISELLGGTEENSILPDEGSMIWQINCTS